MHRLSLVVASGGYSPVAVHRLLVVVASPVVEHRLYGVRAPVVVAPQLWKTGSTAVAHRLSCSEACGIFLTHCTHVSCTGRQILYH